MQDDYLEDALTVMSRIGCRPDVVDPWRGSVVVRPEICHGGVIRPSVLMLLADMVVGMRLDPAFPEWTYTTDFSIRMSGAGTAPGETLTAAASVLRHGRRLLIEEVEYTDESGALVAHAQITFIRQPLREGESKPELDDIRARMLAERAPALGALLADAAGLELLDGSLGWVRMEARDDLRRSGGFIQGAMMSLLGEVSAQALAEQHFGVPCVVSDLDIRYLIGGRSGPLVATARWLGEPGISAVAVRLVDQGHDDVATTTFLARVSPATLT